MKKLSKNIVLGLKNCDAKLFDYKDINSDYIDKDRRKAIKLIINNIRSNISKLRFNLDN
jgi:hypothetical protein